MFDKPQLFILYCFRLMAELELQKKQNSSTLKKLKTETKNLQSEINTLNLSVSSSSGGFSCNSRLFLYKKTSTCHVSFIRLNEWRLGDTVDDCTTYTFLHNTLLLQLTFEKLHGRIFCLSRAVWFNRSVFNVGTDLYCYGRVSLGCDL